MIKAIFFDIEFSLRGLPSRSVEAYATVDLRVVEVIAVEKSALFGDELVLLVIEGLIGVAPGDEGADGWPLVEGGGLMGQILVFLFVTKTYITVLNHYIIK